MPTDFNTIRQIFTRAWKIQNIRPPDNSIRHEFKSTHCIRKFFETHAMKSTTNNINLIQVIDCRNLGFTME